MQSEFVASGNHYPVGEAATHPLARPDTWLALSLLLAGGDPAALSLRAIRAPERTIGRVQLRFPG
jgi:hypothetical protein